MQEDPAGIPDGYEEIDLNEVGAWEELCDEKDERSCLPPHFGNYDGIGSQYVGKQLLKVVFNQQPKKGKIEEE